MIFKFLVRSSCIAVVLLTTTSRYCYAQDWQNLPRDELFALARTQAFEGDREAAREKLYHLLSEIPEYTDVRILLARTYAWDARMDEARKELLIVLQQTPKYQDGINAAVDVEIWDERYEAALKLLSKGLGYYPTSADLLLKKATALQALSKSEEALTTLNELLTIYPSDERAIELRSKINTAQRRWMVGIRTGVDFFSKSLSPAFYASPVLSRSNDWGSAFMRANYSRRFQADGLQGEIDLYPKLFKGAYGYLNYGFSKSVLFPNHRIGAELYSRVGKGLEASVGYRRLVFANAINIYTGSISWYQKRMLFTLRPYITPDKQAGAALAFDAQVRRYFGSPNDFLELNGGIGFAPDARTLQSADGLATNEIYTLMSHRIGLRAQKQLSSRWQVQLEASFTRQELNSLTDDFLYMSGFYGTLFYRF